MSNTENTKVTIYFQSEFGMGINAIEAKLVEHGTRKYAQYASAPFVKYIPKRARRVRMLQQSYKPSLLIVKGWNQPKPDSMFGEAVVRNGVTVSRGRYSGFDPRWRQDFDAMMTEQNVEIVADYRDHDSHNG